MAMKPVGKAIVVGLVALGVAGGVYFSGALNKLPKQETPAAATVPEQSAPAPQPTVVTNPAPTPVEQPQAAQAAPSNDAFDALISKGKK